MDKFNHKKIAKRLATKGLTNRFTSILSKPLPE